MTIEEIQTALAELVAAMVEKEVRIPSAKFSIRTEDVNVYLSGVKDGFHSGETPAEAFDKARAYIDALPSPEESVTREYLGKVADAIDFGTKHSIEDKYVTPLRGVAKAMTDNLLTKEPTT